MKNKKLIKASIVITLLILWSGVSWYMAKATYLNRANELLHKEMQVSQVRAKDLAGSIGQNLNYLSGIPGFFSNAVRVRQGLALFGPQVTASTLPYDLRKARWTNEPTLKELSQTLSIAKRELNTDLVYVVNAAGDGIASSNWNEAGSSIGTNFADL